MTDWLGSDESGASGPDESGASVPEFSEASGSASLQNHFKIEYFFDPTLVGACFVLGIKGYEPMGFDNRRQV